MVNFDKITKNIDVKLTKLHNSDIIISLKLWNILLYFSQLSDVYNMETLKLLGISEDDNKYYFVGKEYGYTGNTCPILCLNRLWDIYSKKGTKIIICTVGAGYSIIVQLYEF